MRSVSCNKTEGTTQAPAWNNNNSESVNNLLKLSVDWKPRQVADLVKHINDLVKQLYSDLWCSLFRQGNYQLAPAFQHPYIPYALGYADYRTALCVVDSRGVHMTAQPTTTAKIKFS